MKVKRPVDIGIGIRAAQEINRLYPKKKHAIIALGCGKHVIYEWQNGVSPSATNLQRLHELGADVIWILTGKREGA